MLQVLASDGVDANERDARLFTPLMWACANGHFRCVEALVKAPREKAVSLIARNESGRCGRLRFEKCHAHNQCPALTEITTASSQKKNFKKI
jgi:ankyrin repeat protein